MKNWNDYKFAFSILTPYSLQLENKVTTTTNNYEINILQNLSVDDLWMGISLAQVFESPLNKANKSSWGVSLYAVKHSETSTTNINFDRKTAPSAGQPDLLMATQIETLDSY